MERISESLSVEVYELFMFEEGKKRSTRKAAIQELVLLMQANRKLSAKTE